MIRNRKSMSCRPDRSRPMYAPCFESTAFRQLNSPSPSSPRCGSRRSIVACFRSRPSRTCRCAFVQSLGRQRTRAQREQSRNKDSSWKSSLVRRPSGRLHSAGARDGPVSNCSAPGDFNGSQSRHRNLRPPAFANVNRMGLLHLRQRGGG